jgi:hypothetical protein
MKNNYCLHRIEKMPVISYIYNYFRVKTMLQASRLRISLAQAGLKGNPTLYRAKSYCYGQRRNILEIFCPRLIWLHLGWSALLRPLVITRN